MRSVQPCQSSHPLTSESYKQRAWKSSHSSEESHNINKADQRTTSEFSVLQTTKRQWPSMGILQAATYTENQFSSLLAMSFSIFLFNWSSMLIWPRKKKSLVSWSCWPIVSPPSKQQFLATDKKINVWVGSGLREFEHLFSFWFDSSSWYMRRQKFRVPPPSRHKNLAGETGRNLYSLSFFMSSLA